MNKMRIISKEGIYVLENYINNISQKSQAQDYNKILKWEYVEKDSQEYMNGIRIIIKTNYPAKYLNFHKNGDYLASISPMAEKKNEEVVYFFNKQLIFQKHIHCISKG